MSTLFDCIREARRFKLVPIEKIAEDLGIGGAYLEVHGKYKAKIDPNVLGKLKRKNGKYIIVTAVVPTKYGEGKTTTAIGLSMALNRSGRKSVCCLRQPSLGPLFGVKGGATGGGASQVIPPEDINFFLTGDFPAIQMSHNLIASFVYNHIHYGKSPEIKRVHWNRVMDINDRSLRKIIKVFKDKKEFKSGFELTAASEIMAVVALAKDYPDLINRMNRIIVAEDADGKPVTTSAIGVSGPATVLLRKAFWPNLLQTCENTPCIMHTGPFGNVAHGNSSIIADLIALKTSDYVITEGGFGAELGFEKFIDLKCRTSGLWPDCAVLVATARAVKLHGNELFKHMIKIVRSRGIPCVVSVNRFAADSEGDLEELKAVALSAGVEAVSVVDVYEKGSEGATELAGNVVKFCDGDGGVSNYFYQDNLSVYEKIRVLAKELYLAEDLELSGRAQRSLKRLSSWGMDRLPVCVAKGHFSLSHDPKEKGIPSAYRLPIADIDVKAGAGFIYALCGNIMTMPGLPEEPVSSSYQLNQEGDLKL